MGEQRVVLELNGEPAEFVSEVTCSLSSEALKRRIQKGEVIGGVVKGRWIVLQRELERLRQPAEIVKAVQEEAAEKRATEKAAESERQAHLKKVADLSMNGPPLPPSIAPMAIPARRKSND